MTESPAPWPPGDKRYTLGEGKIETVLLILAAFEKVYGVDSEAFYPAHFEGASTVRHIPRHQRLVWADFCAKRDHLTKDIE